MKRKLKRTRTANRLADEAILRSGRRGPQSKHRKARELRAEAKRKRKK
jgi:hypothetical protein